MKFLDIFRVSKIKEENAELKNKLKEIGCDEYDQVKAKIEAMKTAALREQSNAQLTLNALNEKIGDDNALIIRLNEEISRLTESSDKLQKQIDTQTRKLNRSKELYKSVEYCVTNFLENDSLELLGSEYAADYDELAPSIILKLHCMDIKYVF